MSNILRTIVTIMCIASMVLAYICSSMLKENRELEEKVEVYKSSIKRIALERDTLAKLIKEKDAFMAQTEKEREESNKKISEAIKSDEKVRDACNIDVPAIFNGLF